MSKRNNSIKGTFPRCLLIECSQRTGVRIDPIRSYCISDEMFNKSFYHPIGKDFDIGTYSNRKYHKLILYDFNEIEQGHVEGFIRLISTYLYNQEGEIVFLCPQQRLSINLSQLPQLKFVSSDEYKLVYSFRYQ